MSKLKSLHEQRNDKVSEMEALIDAAKAETRAVNADETAKFTALEGEIKAIDDTIALEERARNIADKKPPAEKSEEKRAAHNAFDAYLRGYRNDTGVEKRADAQSTVLNENIIPSEFSTDIIRKVTELSGVFNSVRKVNSKGVFKQIVEQNKITAGWTPELTEVMKSTADFKILEIGHHKLGALVKLSLEIINQAEFDIVGEVTQQMVDAFTLESEKAIIAGTGSDRPLGLFTGGTPVNLAAASAITADELIKIFHALKAPFIPQARWIISRNTLLAVRLLKDANDRYLFHEGTLTDGFAGYILGKPVVLSEVMPDYQFLFGDFNRAYRANVNPGMTIQALNELYITQGARGLVGFFWFDGRPVDDQAYIVAKGS